MLRFRISPRTKSVAILAAAMSVLVSAAQAAQSWSLTLPGEPGRGEIAFRVTAPAAGAGLPILLFSPGSGYSKDDYTPLVDDWADHGFVVLQPTHLDAKVLALPADDPRRATIWRSRRDDLVYLLDHLADIERAAPALRGRPDARRVVVAGHSYGGHTAAQLLGMTVVDPATGRVTDLGDPRVSAGVLLAPAGAFDGLAAEWQPRAPYLKTDWSKMTRPALVVVGSHDVGVMNPKDYHWRANAYDRAPPGAACLLTIDGAGHFLGGIDGPGSDTAGDKPAAVRLIQTSSAAWLEAGLKKPWPAKVEGVVRAEVAAPDALVCK